MHRTVRNVMTMEVVVAHPGTSFKEIASLLQQSGITAVPVVDERNHPIGVVSEADLVRKEARLQGSDTRFGARWLPPHGRARAEAETADGLMSSPAVTARPEWSIVEAARVMDRSKVKRLPVVDEDGRLVGIVSRRDLLKPFLRDDAALREEIIGDVLEGILWLPVDVVDVAVDEGVVTLTGAVERKSIIPLIERLCRAVDGVVAVHQTLTYSFDDTHVDIGQPQPRGILGGRSPHH